MANKNRKDCKDGKCDINSKKNENSQNKKENNFNNSREENKR